MSPDIRSSIRAAVLNWETTYDQEINANTDDEWTQGFGYGLKVAALRLRNILLEDEL
jgi:hypothetical protein